MCSNAHGGQKVVSDTFGIEIQLARYHKMWGWEQILSSLRVLLATEQFLQSCFVIKTSEEIPLTQSIDWFA